MSNEQRQSTGSSYYVPRFLSVLQYFPSSTNFPFVSIHVYSLLLSAKGRVKLSEKTVNIYSLGFLDYY